MANFLHDMKALNLQNRTIGLLENGSWAPAAGRQIQAMLQEMKDVRVLDPVVTVRSSLKGETLSQLDRLKENLLLSLSL